VVPWTAGGSRCVMASRRAGGWQDCSEQNPCPVCLAAGKGAHPGEGNTWCSWNRELEKTGSEAFTCCKCGGMEIPGWRIFSAGEIGTVYVPTDARIKEEHSPELQALRAKRDAERAAESENFREAARMKGRAKWMLCGDETIVGTEPACLNGRGPHHPRVAAYIEARGVKLADLPRGELPRSLKYHGAMRDGVSVKEKGKESHGVFFELPAVVCLAVQKNRRKFGAIQRIYLDAGGEPKKASAPLGVPDKQWDAKRARGSLNGAAVRLHSPPVGGGGVLVLTEGVETGLACLAATHAGVWACVSTAGLETIDLDDSYVCEHGPVETVVIAADCDRAGKKGKRPGQDAAAACAKRLSTLFPQLTIRVALPTIADAPELFDELGEPKGKSVDWLDVYNAAGKERVRRALLELSTLHHKGVGDNVAGSGSWGGDEGRGIAMIGGDFDEAFEEGAGQLPMARALLLDWRDFSPEPERRPNERLRLVNVNGTPYLYEDHELPRWVATTEVGLRCLAWPMLQRYPIWDGDLKVPLNPDKKLVDSVVSAMMAETAVRTKNLAVWIAPTFDARGKAIWAGERRRVEPAPADWHIPCKNGILDVNALVDGVVKLQPSTPLLFTTSCRPFDVDAELLRRLIRASDEEAEKIGEQYWPAFSAYLKSVSGGDRDWVELLQRACGLSLTPDTSYECIFLLPGPPGSGKSTLLDILAAIVGEDGFVTTTLSSMSKDFGLVPLVNKNVIALSDAGAGRYTDLGQSLEMLKMLSGGDKVTVEYKGKNEMPTLRLPCKIFIATNAMPKLPDKAGALERRLIPIPFTIPLGKSADRSMKPRVVAEAPFIFLWALRGLVRLRRDPAGFQLTPRGLAMVQEIKESNEPMFVYLAEECELGRDYYVVKADFRTAYNEWAVKNGHNELNATAITNGLQATLPSMESDQLGSGGRERIYRGLRLRSGLPLYEPRFDQGASGAAGEDDPPAPPFTEEPPF